MRPLLALLLVLLPRRARLALARRVPGWEIDRTAYLGRSWVAVPRLVLGPGASIGPFNVLKDLDAVELAEGASIGSRNWITGFPSSSRVYTHSPNRRPVLLMGRFSGITIAHDIDCSDAVELEHHAVIAGFRCAVLTHSLDLVRDRFVTRPLVIGHHSAVMSGCTLNSGTGLPPRSVLSSGSVVNTRLTQELGFYRGNPAERVRDLPETLGFFRREGLQHQIAAEQARLSGLAGPDGELAELDR